MNRILTATALVAMAALTAAPALAATAMTTTTKPAATTMAKPATPAKPAAMTPAAKPAVVTFKSLDANHDGKISLAEIQKVWPKTTKAEFAKYDANKDGFYDHADLAAFAKSMAPAKPSK